MSVDREISGRLDRLIEATERRNKDAAERHNSLLKTISGGFSEIAKEIHDGFVLIQHTMLDIHRERR